MSIFIDTLAQTIIDSRDDADATHEDWLKALDIAFGPQTGVHVWSNTLTEAIADCLTNREEPEAARAVTWLKHHENDSALWELLNHHLDAVQQMATTQTQE